MMANTRSVIFVKKMMRKNLYVVQIPAGSLLAGVACVHAGSVEDPFVNSVVKNAIFVTREFALVAVLVV